MKITTLITGIFCVTSFASFAFAEPTCIVKSNSTGVETKLTTLNDVAQGTINGIKFTVIFNDSAKMAEVGIEVASLDSLETTFYTPTSKLRSLPRSFDYAVVFSTKSTGTYFLNCKE